MFVEEKSRVVKLTEERCGRFGNPFGHRHLFSSKHHCECAGQGIEYDNGQSKWWYRAHCDTKKAGMKRNTALSVSKTITLAHTRNLRANFHVVLCTHIAVVL